MTERLFEIELRPDEIARANRQRAAQTKLRCPSCGRFTDELHYETLCGRCLRDSRDAIVHKVDQVRRWWTGVRGEVWTA